ncbi:MAG: hypothetical protein D6785_11445 [Planctomycetota bacterium]|nr:MAG: hypothetical protein D6785_11445 [Planctomycetota bacterium]
MEWLYQYEEWIDVAMGAVSLITMLVVIFLNYRANRVAEKGIEENKLVRELEKRPYVFFQIEIDLSGNWVNFVLENKGKGVARNIKLSLEQEILVSRQRKTVPHTQMAISKPISFLAPGGRFEEYAEAARPFFQDNKDLSRVTGKVEYEDLQGKKLVSPVSINMKSIANRRFLVESSFSKLVNEINAMTRFFQMKR